MKGARCAAWIWYRGDRFRGFQTQPGGQTVQQALLDALARAGVRATLSAPAGRTDLGVHARMQVLSLRLPADVNRDELASRLSPALPERAIGFVSVKPSPAAFQAHWSATGKEYRYRFALGEKVPSHWDGLAWHVRTHPRFGGSEPDPGKLEDALHRAIGARDFIAFHEKTSVRKVRTLASATLHELGGGVFEARLVGDAFARYQVRYLVGAAALVATGVVTEAEFGAALDSGAPMHGVKAPAEALVLWEVHYPEALDPFSRTERAAAPGVPPGPPFAPGE
ncbi:MAG: tRNA pseudouridine(38-40) synthase TruA [Myxococcaceae bacterium]